MSSHLTWPQKFVRERVDTASNLRKEIQERGVGNEAASFLGTLYKAATLISTASAIANILDKVGVFDPSGMRQNLEKVKQAIELLWGEGILDDVIDFNTAELKDVSYTPRSKAAIERVKNTTINDPEELTFKIERAYRDLWVMTTNSIAELVKNRDENKPIQLAAVSLLGILDGLYQRDDIGTSSLTTTDKSYHG